MKCFHCKKELPEGSTFCDSCGAQQGFEQALLDSAMLGDKGAMTELFARSYESVYYALRALIREEETVLILLQKTYGKAFANLDKLRDPDKFRAWVVRIGHNLAVDQVRRTRPLLFSEPEEDAMQGAAFREERPQDLPEIAMDQKETERLLERILGALSPDQRLATILFYHEQRSVREVAGELGLSEDGVKSRLLQGRQKIENRVRDLEREGVSLRFVSPVGLVLLLLRNRETAVPAIPADRILDGAVAQAEKERKDRPAAAPVGAGRPGARPAPRPAEQRRPAAQTAPRREESRSGGRAGKIAALIVAAAVIVGGGLFAAHLLRQNSGEEPETIEIEADRTAERATEGAQADGTETVISGDSGAAATPEPERELSAEAAAAYLQELQANSAAMHPAYADSDYLCVALADVCGDGEPELLYLTISEEYRIIVHVRSYENGAVRNCGDVQWSIDVAGCRPLALFQLEGERAVYAYAKDADMFSNPYLRRWTFDQGASVLVEEVAEAYYPDPYEDREASFTFRGQSLSEDEYNARMGELLGGVRRLLLYDNRFGMDSRKEAGLDGASCIGMSYDVAAAQLQNR